MNTDTPMTSKMFPRCSFSRPTSPLLTPGQAARSKGHTGFSEDYSMRYAWLLLLILLQPALFAQNAIPAGTVLPVRLDTGLNADRIASGKVVRAEVMQNIPG